MKKISIFIFFIVLLSSLLVTSGIFTTANAAPPTADKPNIIFILTDDQDVDSFNRFTMPNTTRYIRDKGARFTNNVIPSPTCCPSRANFLSGQYNHNNNVLANGSSIGGYKSYYSTRRAQGIGLGYHIGSFMRNGGYKTALIGKYLNEYGDGYIENNPATRPEDIPGWDKWFAAIDSRDQKYYNYKIRFSESPSTFDAGINDYRSPKTSDVRIDAANQVAHYTAPVCRSANCPTSYALRQQKTFSERIFVNQTIQFLKYNADPAFVWYATDAPHGTGDSTLFNHKIAYAGGAEYMPQDASRFADLKVNPVGSYNETDVSDKPDYIRKLPRLSWSAQNTIRLRKIARWRSLYSLDRELGRLYSYLDRTREGDNTILVFTSDNGFMSGQHRVPTGKLLPYREVTETPFVIAGSGITSKQITNLSSNIDLVPTVLGLANLPQSVVRDPSSGQRQPIDGVDLSGLIKGTSSLPNRQAILLESPAEPGEKNRPFFEPYRGVRTRDTVYVEYYNEDRYNYYSCLFFPTSCLMGRSEFYDIIRDPDQKENLYPKVLSSAYGANDLYKARLKAKFLKTQEQFMALRGCSGEACQINSEVIIPRTRPQKPRVKPRVKPSKNNNTSSIPKKSKKKQVKNNNKKNKKK